MQLLMPQMEKERSPSEETLVRRASTGDAEAFADLYERYLNRLFRYFYYRLGHREDAEDLTEQVFLRAWQAIGAYDCRGLPFSAWVFRIAHNLLVDHRRTRREVSSLDEEIELEDESIGPGEILIRKAEAQELSRALAQLSSLEQSVVALRFIEGMDHRSVAKIVGKSEVATRSIQMRALDRLGRILGSRERSQL